MKVTHPMHCMLIVVLPLLSGAAQPKRYEEKELLRLLRNYVEDLDGNASGWIGFYGLYRKIDPDKFLHSIKDDPAYAEFWRVAWSNYLGEHGNDRARVAEELVAFSNRSWPIMTPTVRSGMELSHSLLHERLYDPDVFKKDPALEKVFMEIYLPQVLKERLYDPMVWIQRFQIKEGLALSEEEVKIFLESKDRNQYEMRQILQPAELAADSVLDNLIMLYHLTDREEIKPVIDQCRNSISPRNRQSIEYMLSDRHREALLSGELLRMINEIVP